MNTKCEIKKIVKVSIILTTLLVLLLPIGDVVADDNRIPFFCDTSYYMSYTGTGVYKSVTGGASWFPVNTGLPQGVGGVLCLVGGRQAGLSAGELYAGTNLGVYKTTNGGQTWNLDGLSDLKIYDLDILPQTGAVYAATPYGVYYRDPATAQWSCIGFYYPPDYPYMHPEISKVAICYSEPNVIYVASRTSQSSWGTWVYKTIDGGVTWSDAVFVFSVFAPWSLAVNPENSFLVYVGAFGYPDLQMVHYYKRSVDGGLTWQSSDSINRALSIYIDPYQPSYMYVSCHRVYSEESGGIYKSTDCGDSWENIFDVSGFFRSKITTNMYSPDKIYCGFTRLEGIGETPYFAKSNDGGITWDISTQGLPSAPTAVTDIVVDISLRSIVQETSSPICEVKQCYLNGIVEKP